MGYNAEQGFITELLVSKDYSIVVDNQIGLNFLNGVNKQAYRYIRKHQADYGKIPTVKVFKKKFPSFKLYTNEDGEVATNESMKFWCDQLREKYKHNTLADSLEAIYQDMEVLETEEAYKKFKETVNKIESQVVLAGRLSLNKDTDKRKEDYLKRQKSGGMTGLPTGIEHWDKLTGGANDEELTVIMGYTGVGKSWLLIIICVCLAKMGYKCMFFTTEMSKEMVMRRVDAVWCGLNYSEFKKGQLKPKDQDKYFKYLDKQAEEVEELIIVEQVTDGIPQISAKIDLDNPDFIAVDGAYLIADDYDEDNWMSTLKVFRGLHQLVLSKHKPIWATTQSKDETGATLKSLQFARMLAQECDIVAVLEQDEQMKNDREARIRPLKLREGDIMSSVCLHWDFNKMDYSSIYSEEIKKVEPAKKEDAKGVIMID